MSVMVFWSLRELDVPRVEVGSLPLRLTAGRPKPHARFRRQSQKNEARKGEPSARFTQQSPDIFGGRPKQKLMSSPTKGPRQKQQQYVSWAHFTREKPFGRTLRFRLKNAMAMERPPWAALAMLCPKDWLPEGFDRAGKEEAKPK